MKTSTYTCDFCDKEITDTFAGMFTCESERFAWLFDIDVYEKEMHLHQDCLANWGKAKKAGQKAAHEAYKAIQDKYSS